MAIGDPDAPEDFGRRIDGNSRIIRRKRPRPRPIGGRADIAEKLPAEYAEFRLENGRTFGEVMGADFFGPPSGADGGKPISDSERQRIRDGNYPLARMVRENPDRFAPRPEPRPLSFKLDNGEVSATPPDVGSFEEEEAPASLSGPAKIAPPLLAPPGDTGFAAATSDLLGKAGDALLPAGPLDEEGTLAFVARTGLGLAPAEGGFTLLDEGGDALFDLAREDAAELGRIWSPEIAGRISTIGLLWREDLTPAEKRKLLAGAIGADKLAPISRPGSGRGRPAGDPAKILARRRLEAYDNLAEAMGRGAPDEEIGELIEDFQTEMLPEVFGTGRFVREFLMDLVPILGNVRSVRHLENDIAEIDRAIETGEWGDATLASGMVVLDFIGIFPGDNLLKAGVKLTGRGLVKTVPHFDGLLAERTIRRFKAQWRTLKDPAPGAREFFGDALNGFSQADIDSLDGLVRNRFGIGGGEKLLIDLGERMDPKAVEQFAVGLPKGRGLKTKKRIFDLRAKFRSDIVAEQSALLGRFAKWFVGAETRTVKGKAVPTVFENKVARNRLTSGESAADEFFRNNPKAAREKGFRDIENLRMHTEDVPIDFVIEDLNGYLKIWVKRGKLSEADSILLRRAMRQMKANGADGMPIVNYATLLARLAAATIRRTEIEGDDDPTAISPFSP